MNDFEGVEEIILIQAAEQTEDQDEWEKIDDSILIQGAEQTEEQGEKMEVKQTVAEREDKKRRLIKRETSKIMKREERREKTSRKQRYKDYGLLVISNSINFRLTYNEEVQKVELILERNINGRIAHVLSLSYLQYLELLVAAEHIFECRQKWKEYTKSHLLSNLWLTYKNNFISFTQYEYSNIAEFNVPLKTFTINFVEFEKLYSFHEIIMIVFPMLKDVERCCFSHYGQNQLAALQCFHCNPVQDSLVCFI